MPLNSPLIVRIIANGAPIRLNLGSRVLALTYEDVEKGDDMLNMTFADPYHQLVDSEQFKEGAAWTVQWGFAENICPPRKVILKRPKYRYGEVEVEALDKGSKLKVEERWSTIRNKTKKQVIEDVAARHGLTPVIDDGLDDIIPFMPFGGKTDWDMLEYIASRCEDHYFKIVDDKLVFTRRKLDAAPIASFDYEPGRYCRILSFEIGVKDQDNAKHGKRTSVATVDPFTHVKEIAHSDESNTSVQNLGNRRPTDTITTNFGASIGSFSSLATNGGKAVSTVQGDSTGKSLPMPPMERIDVKKVADGRRRKGLLDAVEATFEIVADPKDPFYKAGDIIQVRGIGVKHSGLYRIEKADHDLTNGYIYKLKTKRNAVNSTAQTPSALLNGPMNKKSGLIAKFAHKEVDIYGASNGQLYGSGGRIL